MKWIRERLREIYSGRFMVKPGDDENLSGSLPVPVAMQALI